MEKVLPKGWVLSNIGQVSEIIRGVSYKKGQASSVVLENSTYILRGGNIQDGKLDFETNDNVYVDDSLVNPNQKIRKDDVVIVGSTGSKKLIGKAGIAENDLKTVSFGAFLMLLRTDCITKRYHSYFFQTKYYRDTISDLAGGVNINNIRKEHLENLEFPLPPLPEQERIVAKLDKLFAQHEKIKKALDRIPQLLKTFRQQVLDNEYRPLKNYDMLSSCCHKIQDGAHHSPKKIYSEKLNGTYPYITSKNIRDNYMKLDSVQYVDEEFHNSIYERCKPEFGDVLLTKDGANTGNVTLNSLDEPFSLLSSVCLIKPKREILLPAFIKYYFQSDIGRSNLLGEMTGTAIKRIVLRKIKTMQIPLPSLHEQQEIVSRIESLFAKADAIESRYQTLKAKIDNLPQAILHKAFKGELVPQLPTDGDAKDLLAEIMALKKEVKGRKKK